MPRWSSRSPRRPSRSIEWLGFLTTDVLLMFALLVIIERRKLLPAAVYSVGVAVRHLWLFDIRCSSRRCRPGRSGSRPPWKPPSSAWRSASRSRLQPDVLWYAFLGCLVGTLVGMLPGIGPLAGISILLPVTFGLDATKAIVMLAGIYYGSQYGGSTTSILMRIPGEAASVMTCIDGYAMAQKGRAGAALCIAAVGSFIAGTFGVIVLTLVAPPLATFALRFGPPEYTALLVLGLIFLAYMSSTSLVRTLLMACLGLLLGMIGIDVMTGHFRYSFDITELGDGIGIVPVAVGLFGLGEILSTPSAGAARAIISPRLRELLPTREEWREAAMPIARGTVLGFLIGIIPGSAHIISSFLSYAVEKRISKHPEEFGKGAVAGVAGPESANNAASTGAFVPMLALGIPTGPVTAVLMARC